jgi:hypothetical protein
LPVSALTALTPAQLELLLAHELAHVKRLDYLVNLLQTAVETALYYHPAVWWVSAQVRVEREHCCDDLAVAACGDAVGYARTLATLEGLRSRTPLAVSATGGSLLHRIQRLTGRPHGERHVSPAWLGALIPAAVVLVAVASVPPAPAPPPVAAPAPAPVFRTSFVPLAPAPTTTATAAKPSPAPGAEPKPAGAEAKPSPAPGAEPKPAGAEAKPSPAPGTEAKPAPAAPRGGFLGGLTAIGYTKISVDEIIKLREHGVDPDYIGAVMKAGLGTPDVDQVIQLREHGVRPDVLAKIAQSGTVSDLNFEAAVRLNDHGAPGNDLLRIGALGFGPFSADEMIRLHDHGVGYETFEALKEAGATAARVDDAIAFRENDVTTARIRSLKEQGFGHLNLEQVLKLRRAGVI